MRAFHEGYRFGWPRFPSLPTPLYNPLSSTDEAQTSRLPCRASTWVGSTSRPSCPVHHHSFTDDTLGDFRRHGPYRDTMDSFSASKPSSGLFRPMISPPIRQSAPGMAPWTLPLLLDRLLRRPSFSPSPTITASVLALPYPSSGLFLSTAVIAPPPPPETLGLPPTTVFFANTCGHAVKIIVPPAAVRLLHDQSFAFTSNPQPELRLRLHFIAVVTTKHRRRPPFPTAYTACAASNLAPNGRWRTPS